MLSRLAANSWIASAFTQQQVLGLIAPSYARFDSAQVNLGYEPFDQQCQLHRCSYHTSSGCPFEQPPKQPTVQPSEAASAADNTDSSSNGQADTQQQAEAAAQQAQAQATSVPAGFATLPGQSTPTGYQETVLVNAANQSEAEQFHQTVVQALPQEKLRIQLRHESKKEVETTEVDAYSLSRSLVGHDAGPSRSARSSSTPQQHQQQELTAADKEVFEKLVGILTKDGKKSRARRILLDAMHIIKQQLAQGKTTA